MKITFLQKPVTLSGKALTKGDKLTDFKVTDKDLNELSLSQMKGRKIFIVVPSFDTGVCDTEIKKFIDLLDKSNIDKFYVVSMDLPFAQNRWCLQNASKKMVVLSDYKYHEFGKSTSTYLNELGLLTRAIIITDEDNKVSYIQYVPEVSNEPNYDDVLKNI